MISNLVQIITGCGCQETVEESAYWTLINGGYVIVVDALWPTLSYPTDAHQIHTQDYIRSDARFEDLEKTLKSHSLHDRFFYLKPSTYMYNGAQYNVALEFIKANKIPCDHIVFFDGDEAIDPVYTDVLIEHIQVAKKNKCDQLRFMSTVEILPGWRALLIKDRLPGNFGFVWGDSLFTRRLEHFDGNFFFETPVPFMATEVPLYHLHHFRKNAARRVSACNTVFSSGGVNYNITSLPLISETNYVARLKSRFRSDFAVGMQGDSYLGTLNPIINNGA